MKQHRNKGEKSITDRIAERAEALAVNRNLFLGKKKYIEIKHGGFKDVSSAKQQHRAGPGFIYLEYTFGSRKEIWLSDKELTFRELSDNYSEDNDVTLERSHDLKKRRF